MEIKSPEMSILFSQINSDGRKGTLCVLETIDHRLIYSGIAYLHPGEENDTNQGCRIALKRACFAMLGAHGHETKSLQYTLAMNLYRDIWHDYRVQHRESLKLKEQLDALAEGINRMLDKEGEA